MMTIKAHNAVTFYGTMNTTHYLNDRSAREVVINKIGLGDVVDSYEVNKGHINGAEIHQVTDTGIIVIFNKNSHKLVTKLIARPQQIIRYYEECGQVVNYNLLVLAMEHEKMGYNNA